ncbi:PREDICTED: uncharacterized protein LOC105365516 [Ceratosolen solmsi marchali]|uniref:Uncharacterized protein LOC105365516 n=1 Tax=Ceratosolen solmsi marchali TaxID=326594 RepID=A0AAJ6YPW3_9HYME|nr:PREDICTED: uncharacterized protein LOC105365516 [Ceratosolen solmsi marchali]
MSESDGEKTARSLALEQAYVHDVYEQCADRTVQGRHWPRIQEFLEELEPGALVCDIGCGNGKYLDVNHSIFKIGVDRCQKFTSIAREKKNEVLVCDNLGLPFRDESFDAVLSIAVVHHLSTTERRIHALKELARVLRIGGRIVISVWAMEQKHRKFESQDVLVPWPKAYCINSSGSPMKPRGMSYDDRRRGKSVQTYLLSKRNSQNYGKNYWIDPIISPSPSTSSLSSPNETCYSFFRRALQKLAGGRRGSRAWFLENWQTSSKERRSGDEDNDGDVEDLPIELRRLEEGATLGRSHHGDSLGIKSKSLGDILEAQRLDLVRSRSSVPGLNNAADETPQQQNHNHLHYHHHHHQQQQQQQQEHHNYHQHYDHAQLPPQSPKSQLVKDKTHMHKEVGDSSPTNTAIQSTHNDVPNFQVSVHSCESDRRTWRMQMALTRRDNLMQKQNSMDEELMSMERLKERESTRRNITKQASLNEEFIYKDRPTFEVFKNTLYSGSATKRFQLLKNGLTSRIRQSTTNIEKVSGISIKNGFVRILQSWTSTENPITSTAPTTAATIPYPSKSVESSERRPSREDGSDSSKDGSLQSDTSVDSEDSFASVIYVPKKSPCPLLESPTVAPSHQQGATSAPPSPRLKYTPELGASHRLKLIPSSPLLKQFPATSKSLPPPSPPGLSPRTHCLAAARPFFSGSENAAVSQQPVPVVAIQEAAIETSLESSEICDEANVPGDEEESRLLGLRQIKELLRQKPGFAARTRPACPLVRHASGPEPVEKLLPRFLELELFNPETDDLDSDSSGTSSPESVGSVISVINEGSKKPNDTPSCAQSTVSTLLNLLQPNKILQNKKPDAVEKRISPVESTWNEECNQHLIDLTDRLSENLFHDINQFCGKANLELSKEEDKSDNSIDNARYPVSRKQGADSSVQHELDYRAEMWRNPNNRRRSGGSFESTDSTGTSEGSQPDSSGPRRLSASWSSRPRFCPQTRSVSEEMRPQRQQIPGARLRRQQQQPSTSNGTLSGSSSQESLPSDQITYHQYYHVFREGELDQLIGKYIENLHVISSYYDHASWCIVAEKVQVWTI